MAKKATLRGKHCCDRMDYDLNQQCDIHKKRSDCPDNLISFHKEHGYGLYVHDGGGSCIRIKFCPWCGTNLPKPRKKAAAPA